MSAEKERRLGGFLREVSNWDWEQFCLAENDPKFTTNEAVVFAIVRACVMEKMEAIKLALNRLDGKLKTPVQIEMPKVFFLYPNAQALPNPELEKNLKHLPGSAEIAPHPEWEDDQLELIPPTDDEQEEVDLPSLSIRQTLSKMADYPRQVPEEVIRFALQTQQWLKGNEEEPIEKPLVKSVVAAHLLAMAASRNIGAIGEVFDAIDGKLVETIQILGEDIFITSYSMIAPEGAYLNSDGVLQLEAAQSQAMWAEKLGNKNGG